MNKNDITHLLFILMHLLVRFENFFIESLLFRQRKKKKKNEPTNSLKIKKMKEKNWIG